jgi:hypothetical protein
MEKIFALLLLLTACQVTVPAKVEQHASGTVTTDNNITIKIEIAIPPEVTQAFQNTCKTKCKDDPNPTCEVDCNAQQTQNYANTLLGFLQQLQATMHPSPTPTPNP